MLSIFFLSPTLFIPFWLKLMEMHTDTSITGNIVFICQHVYSPSGTREHGRGVYRKKNEWSGGGDLHTIPHQTTDHRLAGLSKD